MPRRTITLTLAALVLVSATACNSEGATPATQAPVTTTPTSAPPKPTEPEAFVVEGVGHAGPKIGSPGAKQTKHLVYCVLKSDYRPGDAVNGKVRSKSVIVDASVADTVAEGEPCPPGEEW
jgi:hypothetical protein